MGLVYKKLAIRIKEIRQFMGTSQEDIARRSGLSRPTIANIESGRQSVTLEQLEDLANALGTTPKGLLKGVWL